MVKWLNLAKSLSVCLQTISFMDWVPVAMTRKGGDIGTD